MNSVFRRDSFALFIPCATFIVCVMMGSRTGGLANGDNRNNLLPNDDSPADDFELVPEANFEAMLSSLLQLNGPAANFSSQASNGQSAAVTNSNEAVNLAKVFELIQKEHRLLKEELISQSASLREKLSISEERDRRNAQEMASLKNELDATKLSLSEKEMEEVELKRHLNYFKECSEKVDAMAAQLMQSDDIINHQKSVIDQFQTDGFVSVQPPMLTDQLLANELTQKDERVKRLEAALANVESESLKAQEDNIELREANLELRGLVAALQSQAEMDKAEWAANRDEMAQQISDLVERLSVLDPEFVAAQPQRTMHQQAPSTNDTLVEDNRTCTRCHFPVVAGTPHPCPGIIDGLD